MWEDAGFFEAEGNVGEEIGERGEADENYAEVDLEDCPDCWLGE